MFEHTLVRLLVHRRVWARCVLICQQAVSPFVLWLYSAAVTWYIVVHNYYIIIHVPCASNRAPPVTLWGFVGEVWMTYHPRMTCMHTLTSHCAKKKKKQNILYILKILNIVGSVCWIPCLFFTSPQFVVCLRIYRVSMGKITGLNWNQMKFERSLSSPVLAVSGHRLSVFGVFCFTPWGSVVIFKLCYLHRLKF